MIQALTAWGPAALWAGVLFFLSAQPDLGAPSWIPFADKVGHLALYGILGACLAWAGDMTLRTPEDRRTRSGVMPHAALVALGVLYGVSDEWHQSFIPGRESSFGDLVADTLGVVAGYAFLVLILKNNGDDGGPAPPSSA